jgi:UDP-arabinose 4-epimerase
MTNERSGNIRTPILVTGGAGYVGSHACKALFQAGYLPVVYDSLERGHRWAVQWGPLEVGNLHDRKRLDEVLIKYKPTAVLHFAAYAYVGESVIKPADYYWNNLAGTVSLLNALVDAGVKRLVFSSTCATFGIPESLPITEDNPQRPINPYGASKMMIERVLADFDNAYGLKSITLRYFNAAGADPEAEIGEAHEPETHLIPLALLAAIDKQFSLNVFGTDYPTIDGTCVRDYVHVSDLANAHLLALKYLDNGGGTCCLNLGTGKPCSVNQVINAAMEVTGQKINVIKGPRRPGDPPYLVADPTRAIHVLGWTPQYPQIKTQIEHAWKWLLKIRAYK